MKEDTIKDMARNLVFTNLEWIEEGILCCALRDHNFWESRCRGLVNASDKNQTFQDFTKPIHNVLYNLADKFLNAMNDKDPRPTLTLEVLLNMLLTELQSNDITPDDFRIGTEEIKKNWGYNIDSFLQFCDHAVPLWVSRKRTVFLSSRVGAQKTTDAEILLEQLRSVQEATQAKDRKETSSFDEVFERGQGEGNLATYYPCTCLPSMNVSWGGGLVAGQCGLIICPSNGGKTVLSNQLSSDWALDKRNVLVVSTEHTVGEMFVRQVSCNCELDFGRLNKGYSAKLFSDKENEKIQKFVKRAGPHIRIEDMRDNPMSLGQDIANLITSLRNRKDNPFDTEILIVDWLGGNAHDSLETGVLSAYLMNTLKLIRDQCHMTNVAGIVMAQAHPKKTKGKARLSSTDSAWCNTLHTYADWGAGVSLLEKDDTGLNDDMGNEALQNNAKSEQFINFFKTRNAPSRVFKVVRDFKFQRFIQPADVSGSGRNTPGLGIT